MRSNFHGNSSIRTTGMHVVRNNGDQYDMTTQLGTGVIRVTKLTSLGTPYRNVHAPQPSDRSDTWGLIDEIPIPTGFAHDVHYIRTRMEAYAKDHWAEWEEVTPGMVVSISQELERLAADMRDDGGMSFGRLTADGQQALILQAIANVLAL